MKVLPRKYLFKSWSLQLISVGILLQAFWIELPTEIKERFPQEARDYITIAFLIVTFLARVIKQDINYEVK